MVIHPAMVRLPKALEGQRPLPGRAGVPAAASATTPDAPAMTGASLAPGERQPERLHLNEAIPQAGAVPHAPEADPARAAALAEQARLAGLAVSCLQGNAEAWELLVRSQQRRVYGLCFRFTGSANEAEDLTQDTFLKVYRNLASFDPGKASFGVWLTALTRNLLVDHYRRSRLERASESLDEPFAGDDDSPTRAERLPDARPGQEQYVAGVELRSQVQAALAQVSPDLREAVILRDLQDLDYREIAEVLGIPQGTVKSRISRGRAELARLLKGLEGQVM